MKLHTALQTLGHTQALKDGSIRPLDTAIAAQLLSSAINAAAELQRWVPGITPDNVMTLEYDLVLDCIEFAKQVMAPRTE